MVLTRFRAALLGVLLFAAWQCLTVTGNYRGNWTALFCTGAKNPVPPALLPNTFLFPSSFGYDGQFYRYVAHDPWLTGNAHRFLDDPILRLRRILVPGLAWALAFGQLRFIDAAYIAIIWLFVFLGCYWCGLGFLLVPATLISLDRLTIDIATCALTAGFVQYWRDGNTPKLYLIAAAAFLSRETGAFLIAAFLIEALANRNWKRALLFSTAGLPALAWYAYLWRYGPPPTTPTGLPQWLGGRLEPGPLIRMLHPDPYPFSQPLTRFVQGMDSFALAAMSAAFLLALAYGIRHWKEAPGSATLLFALSFLTVSRAFFWDDINGYVRPFSPMLLLPALAADPRWKWTAAALCLVIDSRISLQFGAQVLSLLGIRYR